MRTNDEIDRVKDEASLLAAAGGSELPSIALSEGDRLAHIAAILALGVVRLANRQETFSISQDSSRHTLEVPPQTVLSVRVG